jgi:release factor glutamine methyltransferase
MMTIAGALAWGARELSTSSCAALEAEVLLAHTLQMPRSYFYTWPARELSSAQVNQFSGFLQRKHRGEPVAYITGQKEFWSLPFTVSPATLIPRPETEILVAAVLQDFAGHTAVKIADLGTGCGAIACALAHEKPAWDIIATDAEPAALALAQTNARQLKISNVSFQQGDWCYALPAVPFDAIVSNPPYIANDDVAVQQAVKDYEPHTALFADDNGLADLRKIIQDAKNYLRADGLLYLEHGATQAWQVSQLLAAAGYRDIRLHKDLANCDRVTSGRFTFAIAS